MKRFIASIILGFLFLVASPEFAYAQSGPSVYWGAYTSDVPAFEANAEKKASLVMIFESWNQGGFPTDRVNDIRSRGSIPVVSWESYIPEKATETSWKRISEGSMDGYITQWAQSAKAWGKPFFLRFDWEMNGYWEPYSDQSQYFVPMWKHVHDIFVAQGATNVTWVWCPNIDGYSTMPLEPLYPGNDYVDWVCMDGYNFGNVYSWSSWQSFSEVYAPTYNHLLKLAPGKPIMVGEISSSENGGGKHAWITDMLSSQLPVNFPNIKAFVWFNLKKEDDWRIESSEMSRIAFANGISSSYYATNTFADIAISPIPYLGNLSAKVAYTAGGSPTPKPTFTPTPIPTITPSITSEPAPLPVSTASALTTATGDGSDTTTREYWKDIALVILFFEIPFFLILVAIIGRSSWSKIANIRSWKSLRPGSWGKGSN